MENNSWEKQKTTQAKLSLCILRLRATLSTAANREAVVNQIYWPDS